MAVLVRRRAVARAELGQREEAAADFRRLFDEDEGDHGSGYALALLSLAIGDGKGCREACSRLLARAKVLHSDVGRLHAVGAAILAPDGGPDPEEAVRQARNITAFGGVGALGAALYRAGKVGEAILQLNKARLYYPAGQIRLLGGMPQDFLFLAMAYRDAGLEAMATQSLAKAEEQIASENSAGSSLLGDRLEWQDRLWRELLLREARDHLRKK
jgi:tetratricopeptide (TPR) repeat protein